MSNYSSSVLLDPGISIPAEDQPEQVVMVVMPTYNEIENIARMLETLFQLGIPNLKVLVVDDNSPDGTGKVVEDLIKEKYTGKVEILHRPGKMGLGPAYIAGFQHALRQGAAFIVEMDADFSHDPAILKRFLEV